MSRNHASTSALPATLAERIRFLRERRYLTAQALALKAQVPLQTVEDLEAGIEMFLAPAVRQRLARVLQVRTTQIEEVEKPPISNQAEVPRLQKEGIDLREAILQDPDAVHLCPSCGSPLAVRMFERRDLHDKPFLVMKANCTSCLFRMTDD